MQGRYSQTIYQQASASGATHIGLLTIVYDALARDLHDAGQCLKKGDIAGRCNHSNHALLLLGHLESWADCLGDTALTASLNEFYEFLRTQILRIQQDTSAETFNSLASLIAETRAAWQSKEQQLTIQRATQGSASSSPKIDSSPDRTQPSLSWSA